MCIARNEGNYKLLPKSMKDICKVYIGEVAERKGNILTLKLNDKKKTIKKVLDNSLNAKRGDKVTVHYGFAIEKL
jgi:hydrogenase maturation factor